MSKADEVKFDIKVVINKDKTKLLFVEAGSDFTDVLLSFLLLPMGTIMNVLKKHNVDEVPVIGSLTTLYNGVANLDIVHFHSETGKEDLIIPKMYYEEYMFKLRLNINSIQHTSADSGKTYDGVLTQRAGSFIISDNLRVMPNVAGSFMNTLSALGITMDDMDGAETQDVALGLNEIMALLKGSLVLQDLLSPLLIPGCLMNLAINHSVRRNIVLDEASISANNKKMVLKVMIQKSTNKLLFAQADDDFINFLFGVLTIPLGRVESYLGSNTGFNCMDNLHRSIAVNFHDKHLNSDDMKNSLLKPKLPKHSPWAEEPEEFAPLNFNSGWNQDHHVVGSRMYMISDDLTVAPLGITTTISVLTGLKISLSDVKELELQVGLKEGLSILKAALTSTNALTDGLIKPIMKKQQSKEKKMRTFSILECLFFQELMVVVMTFDLVSIQIGMAFGVGVLLL